PQATLSCETGAGSSGPAAPSSIGQVAGRLLPAVKNPRRSSRVRLPEHRAAGHREAVAPALPAYGSWLHEDRLSMLRRFAQAFPPAECEEYSEGAVQACTRPPPFGRRPSACSRQTTRDSG